MSRFRSILEKILALGGIVVILAPVAFMATSWLQVTVVVLGILMIEAGVWGLAGQILPEQREYHQLREEVNVFLEEVRELNDHAVAGDRAGLEEVGERLHARVDAIVDAAGKEGQPAP